MHSKFYTSFIVYSSKHFKSDHPQQYISHQVVPLSYLISLYSNEASRILIFVDTIHSFEGGDLHVVGSLCLCNYTQMCQSHSCCHGANIIIPTDYHNTREDDHSHLNWYQFSCLTKAGMCIISYSPHSLLISSLDIEQKMNERRCQ